MITFGIVETAEDVKKLADMCCVWTKEQLMHEVTSDELAVDIQRTVDSGVVIFAKEDEKLIGLMSGVKINHFWIKEIWAHEHFFFILPDYRNKKIGSKLVDIFCKWADINKCKSVIIMPNKFGSVTPEKIKDHLIKDGFSLHGYSMRKELTNV